jgi:hypothetical protein
LRRGFRGLASRLDHARGRFSRHAPLRPEPPPERAAIRS